MKVEFWVVGKTQFTYLNEGIALYEKRLGHYLSFNYKIIPDIKNTKNLNSQQIKEKEGKAILDQLEKGSHLILLDENGKGMTSIEFSNYLDKKLQQSYRKIIFLVGGAYGFSPDVKAKANGLLSLSKMTFSHQMVRLFFIEQLYRAMTIARNEPYHHQ